MRIILFTLLVLSFGCNTNTDKGFTDKSEAGNELKNGQKEGKWVEYADSADKIVTRANAPFYYLTIYKSGKPFGIVREYDKTGIIQSETPYVNGLADGFETLIGDNNSTVGAIPFVKGKKEGIASFYFADGKVMTEVPYKNDEKNGIVKNYHHSNGTIETEIEYKNGKQDGMEKEYYSDGKLMFDALFRDGQIQEKREYDLDGNVKSDTKY
jgi:antitoxin component YwqK of YwqJK toxin-antitoxin module